MTAQPTGSDGATPVDRRWFEEALRSQGFVVEPPTDDIEPDPGLAVLTASAQVPTDAPPDPTASETPVAAPAVERPPMPSALLARIAARGQPASAVESVVATTPGPEVTALEPDPAPIAGSAIALGPSPSPGAERVAPWASAVVTSVAPWEPTPALSPTVAEAEPTGIDEPPPMVESAGVDAAAAEDVPIDSSEPMPAVEPPIVAAQHPAAPSAVLDSPYPTTTVASATTVTQPRPVAVPAAPAQDASEGELWALVGASEPAAAQAPASEAARVVLTILTAFLLLVIVVGSLVLASQIA